MTTGSNLQLSSGHRRCQAPWKSIQRFGRPQWLSRAAQAAAVLWLLGLRLRGGAYLYYERSCGPSPPPDAATSQQDEGQLASSI